MVGKQTIYRGCLLGLAVGDAMGYTIDERCWEEIQCDYGPDGLRGYDLVNGYADVSSYTQLAAFTCNGLLLGLTRGQMQGKMAPFVKYIGLSMREWGQNQRYRADPGRTFCWVSRVRELCTRRCMDTTMLDTISQDRFGSMEEPVNHSDSPGALTTAVAVGLFSNPRRVGQSEIDRLAAETIALTQGCPTAFLSGAVLAHLISGLVSGKWMPMEDLIQDTINSIQSQFGREYPQTVTIWETLRFAITLAKSAKVSHVEAMEALHCQDCHEVLAGAVYAYLVCDGDFDKAMIVAVNHSGRSAAVGAITGALLGARLGQEALPEFYIECLEPVEVLEELADDLIKGCPMERLSNLFDDDWDQKYIQGRPVQHGGWAEI